MQRRRELQARIHQLEAEANRMRVALNAGIRRMGPFNHGEIIVVSGLEPGTLEALANAYIGTMQRDPDAAFTPPVFLMLKDNTDISEVPESVMNAAGWYRQGQAS